MKHRRRVSLWLTSCEDNSSDDHPSPMTTAEISTASSDACVWAEGDFLSQSMWILRNDRVLPRVGDLVVRLYRTALQDRVSLLEVVLTDDSRSHLQSAPRPDSLIHRRQGPVTAVHFVDPQSDELRYWLDMMLGLGYTWSLATPGLPAESLASIDEHELEDALRGAALCITEHDGEILQISVRDEATAKTILHQLEQVAEELGYEVTSGP